jgi:tape measure domain-containing protein
MATLGSLSVNITANVGGLKRGFDQGRAMASSFTARIQSMGSGVIDTFGRIGLAAQGAKTMIGGLVNVARSPLKLAAEAEQTAVSFRVLLGSAEAAQDVMVGLKQFAAETPFEFPELASAGKKLIAFGTSGDQVVPTLRRLGDLAAGLGIPIGELSEIYGKARVQGTLFMEDINQLAGRGIPIQTELAKIFGVTGQEVRALVSSGQVNFGHLEEAFKNLTDEGGQFAGLMKAQSNTLSGTWAALSDSVSASMATIGESIADGLNLKAVLNTTAEWLGDMTRNFQILSQNWGEAWDIMALQAQSVIAQVGAVLEHELSTWGKGTRGFFEGIALGLERFNPFGKGNGNLFRERERNQENERLDQEIRTILERAEKRGSITDQERSRIAELQRRMQDNLDQNLEFSRRVHGARDNFESAVKAAQQAAKPFEDEIRKRWEAMERRFEAANASRGGRAESSKERELAARQEATAQAGTPGLIEAGTVEAMRLLAKFSQPRDNQQRVEQQQLAVLREIRDGIREPEPVIELA